MVLLKKRNVSPTAFGKNELLVAENASGDIEAQVELSKPSISSQGKKRKPWKSDIAPCFKANKRTRVEDHSHKERIVTSMDQKEGSIHSGNREPEQKGEDSEEALSAGNDSNKSTSSSSSDVLSRRQQAVAYARAVRRRRYEQAKLEREKHQPILPMRRRQLRRPSPSFSESTFSEESQDSSSSNNSTNLFLTLPDGVIENIGEYCNQSMKFTLCMTHRLFQLFEQQRFCELIDLRPVGKWATTSGRRVTLRGDDDEIRHISEFLRHQHRFRLATTILMNECAFINRRAELLPLVEKFCPHVKVLHLICESFGAIVFTQCRKGLAVTESFIQRFFRGRQIERIIIEDTSFIPHRKDKAAQPREKYVIEIEAVPLSCCTAFLPNRTPCIEKRIPTKLYCHKHLKSRQPLQCSLSRQRDIEEEYLKRVS